MFRLDACFKHLFIGIDASPVEFCSSWDRVLMGYDRVLVSTHRPLSSSFLGLPYRSLNMDHEKELLRGLWVGV